MSDPLCIPPTLVVTGHFPPEPGGVQTFTWEFVRRLPADRLVVVAPSWPGDAEFDAGLDFPVVRRHGYLLFRGLRGLIKRHGIETAWITAMAPFGMYAPLVRAAGAHRLVASTHGQEIGWIRAAPTRRALREVSRAIDTVTYLSPATLGELEPVFAGRTRLHQLAGGVDTDRFSRYVDASTVRERHHLRGGPVVLSVSRLVRRKGHDRLLQAWPAVLAQVPTAKLVVVGDGPMRAGLTQEAAQRFPDSVVVTGPVSPDLLPAYYAAADVFVFPSRDDRRGLQTEGLGLSTLEASAAGLPVVVGRSGGSAASLKAGQTGLLVDATSVDAVAHALVTLLRDPARAAAMGRAGRQWMLQRWTWPTAAARLAALLRGDEPQPVDVPASAERPDDARAGDRR